MSFYALAVVVGLLFASAAVNAEEVREYRMCRNTKCSISNLVIDPCAEAGTSKPCRVPHGKNASITFNYIPGFSSKKPQTQFYAVKIIDLPLMGMDTNACLYTECPMVANQQRSWKYNLFIASYYPKGAYTVKFKSWGGDKGDNKKQDCCFTFNIRIV